jgi:hypothetical protein
MNWNEQGAISNIINVCATLAGIRGQQNSMNLKGLVGSHNILFKNFKLIRIKLH